MQMVYEAFLDILMGITREYFENSCNACEALVEHPEIYSDGIRLTVFQAQLANLMKVIGIEDFSIRDLIKPDAQRTQRILSAVMNFSRFRQERLDLLDKVSETFNNDTIKEENLGYRIDEMKMRLESLRAKRKEEEPQIAQAREVNALLTDNLRDLKRQQVALSDGLDVLKQERGELTEDLVCIYLSLICRGRKSMPCLR